MSERLLQTASSSANSLTRREGIATLALLVGGLTLGAKSAFPMSDPGIAYSAATIHQEPVFAATPQRVYDVLTDAAQFQKVQLLNGDLKALDLTAKPAEISRVPGGAIKLFGGYISGRQIDLEPGKRIVQAWRSESWPDHIYSIARFELLAEGSGTMIAFDHTGFPVNEAEHLAAGWKAHYWDALSQYLKS